MPSRARSILGRFRLPRSRRIASSIGNLRFVFGNASGLDAQSADQNVSIAGIGSRRNSSIRRIKPRPSKVLFDDMSDVRVLAKR
jgi:hypothetical protein